jgi:pantothenate kinase
VEWPSRLSPLSDHQSLWLDPPEILLREGNNILQEAKETGPLSEIIDLPPKVGWVSWELSKRSNRSRALPLNKQEVE